LGKIPSIGRGRAILFLRGVSDSEFVKGIEDAKLKMFKTKEEPGEDVVDKPDAIKKPKDDCATSVAVFPHLESSLASILYS
jgi:hypothetical protein